MNMLDVVMSLVGQVLFPGGESTEMVSKDHILAGLVFNGQIIFLQMK